jgi:hypothetical protein
MTLQVDFAPRNSTERRRRSTVEELGRRSTDVLNYGESDSGVRFVLIDRGRAWSLFRNCPHKSTWASHEDRGRLPVDTRNVRPIDAILLHEYSQSNNVPPFKNQKVDYHSTLDRSEGTPYRVERIVDDAVTCFHSTAAFAIACVKLSARSQRAGLVQSA